MARRLFMLAWLALVGVNCPSIIQADDPPSALQDAATRARLAKDALKATVDSAISKAGKLDADAASIVLQSAETEVNEASYLSPADKKALLGQIAARKKELSKPAAAGAPASPTKMPREEVDKNERIREELNIIKALDKNGDSATAKKKLKELAAKYPGTPAISQYLELTSRSEMLNDYNRLSKARGSGEQSALNDVGPGAVPPNGSIQYDKKAFDNATKRKPFGSVANNLSKREKEILAILDQFSKTHFNFSNTSFEQVKKQLEDELGMQLVIGKQTMEEVRLTYESTLSYEIPKGVTKRNLLKSVLSELGLTYVIKGEILQVVSFTQAKSELRTGMLDVGTLIRNGQNADALIKLIKLQVEPDSWEGAGGNGTITYAGNGLLVIKNSAEVIYQLGARPK
jgi:hypothetical protein